MDNLDILGTKTSNPNLFSDLLGVLGQSDPTALFPTYKMEIIITYLIGLFKCLMMNQMLNFTHCKMLWKHSNCAVFIFGYTLGHV